MPGAAQRVLFKSETLLEEVAELLLSHGNPSPRFATKLMR